MYYGSEIPVHYRIASMCDLVGRIIRVVVCHDKVPAPEHIRIAYLTYCLHRTAGFHIFIPEFLIKGNHNYITGNKCLWSPEIDITVLFKAQ